MMLGARGPKGGNSLPGLDDAVTPVAQGKSVPRVTRKLDFKERDFVPNGSGNGDD